MVYLPTCDHFMYWVGPYVVGVDKSCDFGDAKEKA